MNGQGFLNKWQRLLQLKDWTILLQDNCEPEDFVGEDRVGEVDYQEVNKTAIIRILDPKFYGTRILPFCFEKVLIHELLHIKFALLSNSDNELQNRIVHVLIEDLAKLLYECMQEGSNADKQDTKRD